MTDAAEEPFAPFRLPRFPVEVEKPDLSPWRVGRGTLPGVVGRSGSAAGPHVVLMSLMHGNELAGAIVLDRLLRSGFTPRRGRLTAVFANLDAFDRFDPVEPTASRFVEEDLNRIWDPATLGGPRVSSELIRARQLMPLLETADVVLDLHSMLWTGEPLYLCGPTERGRALACAIGQPPLVVADRGHAGGRRLIDHPSFTDPDGSATALLIEAGQHWAASTVDTTAEATRHFLAHLDMGNAATDGGRGRSGVQAVRAPRVAQVTATITANTAQFSFTSSFRGGDLVPAAGTLIAFDGSSEIRTPYDDCLLVMPNLRPTRGHTAVRLARYLD